MICMARDYIISVSTKSVFDHSEPSKEELKELAKVFGIFGRSYDASWRDHLSEGAHEVLYRSSLPDQRPLEPEKVKHLKNIFDKGKKNIEFYELVKVE